MVKTRHVCRGLTGLRGFEVKIRVWQFFKSLTFFEGRRPGYHRPQILDDPLQF